MSTPRTFEINIDGAARGNPGPAAFAYVIEGPGVETIQEAGRVGRLTNNQAEYTALVRALEHAAHLGAEHRLLVLSDSELMVKQMNGEYKVKNEDLRDLYERAVRLRQRFASVEIRHVRRALNAHADRLCNEALDGLREPTPLPPLPEPSLPKPPRPPAKPSLDQEAVACLRAAADAWARGGPDPTPEAVWRQLWSVLEAHNAVRRPKAR